MSLNNFRSIGGRITVPLDAQVVLIYGPNGAGKTSVLSGLELALTGSIDAMQRVDPNYREHLVHRGEANADVKVATQDLGSSKSNNWDLIYGGRGWVGSEALSEADARFFSERCYLAQATLGRLMEIYGSSEIGQDSALARFVNDVLGLDALENLIDGLHPARDIRNTRRLVPEVQALESDLARVRKDESASHFECERLETQQRELEEKMRAELVSLDPRIKEFSLEALTGSLHNSEIRSDKTSLTKLSSLAHDIQAMVQRSSAARASIDGADIAALEAAAAATTQVAADWLEAEGAAIDQILTDARSLFANLPSISETNPAAAVASGLSRVTVELQRATDALNADEAALRRQVELEQAAERERSRIAMIDEQIVDATEGAADVARLLADLIPHIHDNECLVCGRDFSEVSIEPLAVEASRRASQFSDQAERLSALSQAKLSATAELNRLTADLSSLQPHILTPSARTDLISRRAQLEQWVSNLTALEDEANRGSGLVAQGANARRAVASARAMSATWNEIRQSAIDVSGSLGLDQPSAVTPLEEVLQWLSETVENRRRATEERVAVRANLSELQQVWSSVVESLKTERDIYQGGRLLRQQLESAQEEIDARRARARKVHQIASEVQQSIIQTVFNEDLNSIWRDLFVRLAPNEPFMPAFHVAEGQRRSTSPQLITQYRGGGQGGSPGAMLSAGNLNTAALTLFLALHLAAGERLPLLILDDPVQSMDDVHISQFAALLRTLSKQHRRQVVIAIHERALFDYLTLELSPAFEGDRLITVELKKQSDGSTLAEPKYREWAADPISVSA
ncbi:AAA family ATPase [Mycolicibacterium sp. OfavD-34-C]|uniref:AAA family ATPase n=1 Tax=Mycolicibacterium sp. OfavD-34-C TaxID=2917746 RepID=UPI001EF5CD66|nr:AAA family ATPase [Mycolicibacterium sp. OfavD-34-C]MCG7583943.1 AAA family ATPase [Mycolicibacterium sp. OfavD-34-C]